MKNARRVAGAASAGLLAALAAAPAIVHLGSGDERIGLRVTGPAQTVTDWTRSACAPDDYPDLPTRAFRDRRGRVQVIVSHYVNRRRLTGPRLDRLRRDCKPVLRSTESRRPGRFDDRELIGSTYTEDGVHVFALLHVEYQGHRHRGRCPSGSYPRCWYNALTYAYSSDGGRRYRQPPPPRQLIAAPPVRYRPDSGPIGLFRPSNIIRRGGMFYVMAHVKGPGGSPEGTCVLRTPRLRDPGAWRAWDGRGFRLRLPNPYAAPPTRACTPVANDEIENMSESLTFNTFARRYLLIGMSGQRDQGSRRIVWGIYASFSDDLVHWTPRALVAAVPTRQHYRCGTGAPLSYPSAIDPRSPGRNFDTTGQRFYIYLTRFNYRRCRQTSDRDLVRIPVELTRR